MPRAKYVINEMVWDLVTSRGKFHLAKVTKVPIHGVWKKTYGEPERFEFILGPNSKWHTGTCYLPVEPKIERALHKALDEYKKHEDNVALKRAQEAAEREKERKLRETKRSLECKVITVHKRTTDGVKLKRQIDTWNLRTIFDEAGWVFSVNNIKCEQKITKLGTYQVWVKIGEPKQELREYDGYYRQTGVNDVRPGETLAKVTVEVKAEPGDAEKRKEEADQKRKKKEEAAAKRKATAERKKNEAEERKRRIEEEARQRKEKYRIAAEKRKATIAAKKKAKEEEKERLAAEKKAASKQAGTKSTSKKKKASKKTPLKKKKKK